MVRALHSRSSGPGSSPGRAHYVAFLGKKLKYYRASHHPGVQMGAGWGSPGVTVDGLASHSGGNRNTPGRFMLLKLEKAPALWASWLVYRLPPIFT